MDNGNREHLDDFEKWRKVYIDNGVFHHIFFEDFCEYGSWFMTKEQALINMTRSIIWYDRSCEDV